MNIHIFNPEHDIALAANLANFTAPHAGRQLRADLDYLPALWAQSGDVVLTDHPDHAAKYWKRLAARLHATHDVSFAAARDASAFQQADILPWGWDKALRAQLQRNGIYKSQLPDDVQLEHIRQLSHRRTAAHLLPSLRLKGTVGEAVECDTQEAVEALYRQYGAIVLKAPWSSSGRGVRYCTACQPDEPLEIRHERWLHNVMDSQGSVMVEPLYDKVRDFGMEFSVANGVIRYEGLSLFQTRHGAYIGNVIATERVKRQALSRYFSLDVLDNVCQHIINRLNLSGYEGPFGIDMMAVKGGLLHPCVEINLRRTMGHVALALGRWINPDGNDDVQRIMRIDYDGSHYRLHIRNHAH